MHFISDLLFQRVSDACAIIAFLVIGASIVAPLHSFNSCSVRVAIAAKAWVVRVATQLVLDSVASLRTDHSSFGYLSHQHSDSHHLSTVLQSIVRILVGRLIISWQRLSSWLWRMQSIRRTLLGSSVIY